MTGTLDRLRAVEFKAIGVVTYEFSRLACTSDAALAARHERCARQRYFYHETIWPRLV